MKKLITITIILGALIPLSCATDPDQIKPHYISPHKYREYECEQLSQELNYIGHKMQELYQRLKQRRERDEIQAAFVWFYCVTCPFLNGDGPEADQYADLKGEFEALRIEAYKKDCRIEGLSADEVMRNAEDFIWKSRQDEEPD